MTLASPQDFALDLAELFPPLVADAGPQELSARPAPADLRRRGGSNSHRLRAWKVHLQCLASEIGLSVSVAHYPPGTSKWNKIEHRLFSFISIHWRGTPLVNYETVVALIGGARTRSRLKVKALLDTREYETGVTVSDEESPTCICEGIPSIPIGITHCRPPLFQENGPSKCALYTGISFPAV